MYRKKGKNINFYILEYKSEFIVTIVKIKDDEDNDDDEKIQIFNFEISFINSINKKESEHISACVT